MSGDDALDRLGPSQVTRIRLTDRNAHAGAIIRIAADACANEAVRVALTSLAEGESDERAIEEALAAEPQRGHAPA